jgi:hypothetical protein
MDKIIVIIILTIYFVYVIKLQSKENNKTK